MSGDLCHQTAQHRKNSLKRGVIRLHFDEKYASLPLSYSFLKNHGGYFVVSYSSVATEGTGGTCPQSQSGRVVKIAEIRGEKLVGCGYRIILAKQITVKYVF